MLTLSCHLVNLLGRGAAQHAVGSGAVPGSRPATPRIRSDLKCLGGCPQLTPGIISEIAPPNHGQAGSNPKVRLADDPPRISSSVPDAPLLFLSADATSGSTGTRCDGIFPVTISLPGKKSLEGPRAHPGRCLPWRVRSRATWHVGRRR